MQLNLLQQIVDYLKNPIYKEKIAYQPFFSSLFQIIRINLLAICISFIIGIAIYTVSRFTPDLDKHAVGEFIEKESILTTFIFACVVAPLLEESAFRLWLINKPLQVAVGVTMFLFYYISSFIPGSVLKSILLPVSTISPLLTLGLYLVGFILSVTFFFILAKSKNVKNRLNILFNYKYKYLFFGSAFLFSLLHISNYEMSWTVALLTPLLILPQLSGGILLSYIRIKYGFWRGVIGHFLYNTSLLVPSLGLKLLTDSGQKLLASADFKFTSLVKMDQITIVLVLLYILVVFILILISNLQLFVTFFSKKTQKSVT
jgi:hypothetical protein